MNRLIIITGDLASGKSTLAFNLSEQLSIPYITKDDLKEILCDAIDYKNREENRKLSIGAVNSMIHIFKMCARVNDDLIVEGNFRLEELNNFKSIANENNYQLITFKLIGDSKILYQRFLDRLVNRHKAHISLGLNKDISCYEEYVQSLRTTIENFSSYTIDMTNLDENEVLSKVLDILSIEGII